MLRKLANPHLWLGSTKRPQFTRLSKAYRSSFILLLGALAAFIAAQWFVASQAQNLDFKTVIKVSNAALPVTIGVPVAESAGVLDAAQFTVTDPNGVSLPSQARVLARWRGTVTDTTKPVKWALIDFKPLVNGNHTLTRTAKTTMPPALAASASASGIRVTTSRLNLEFPNQGSALLSSFQLDRAEQLRAPLTVQASVPRGSLIAAIPAHSADTLIVSDTTLLSVGSTVRFEHRASIKWGANAGSTQLISYDPNLLAHHSYRLDEGTSRQEDITVAVTSSGTLKSSAPLKFNHADGGTIRDLSVEQESATIKSINGQHVQFAAPLKQTYAPGSRMYLSGASLIAASATIERAAIEEANALRAVVRQDGHFNDGAARVTPTISFTLRYYIYADQPFIRVRLRLHNEGVYGFGALRTQQGPYAQHALLRSLSALIPTTASGASSTSVLNASGAHQRVAAKQNTATLSAGAFEIAVPEFAENFPKALSAGAHGLRFDMLPDISSDHQFDGARAKTTDFYLGRSTLSAAALSTSTNATLEPADAAQTGAIHPAMVEKRNWAAFFPQDAELGEAAVRAERWLASAYAVEASEGVNLVPAQSVFEYRLRGEQGEHFGWRNFGDLAWGDGYANLHYDLPFIVLREFLRTGDARAFQLGGEMARHRADWGQYHADDYWDNQHAWNMRGLAFYEKGDHGSFREPLPSHTWIEGLWLYWALTGDEAIRESAMEASHALARMPLTYDSALSWNEPRWVGWPVLGLMAAWRYTGESKYLDRAKNNAYLLVQAEEDYGKKGYFIPSGSGIGRAVQPFMWSGYAQLGVIEYWRETGDQRVADYLVRIADWLIGKGQPFPVLTGGKKADGNYQPLGAPYFWYPDKASEGRSVELGMMSLPVLVAAARISNRDDLRAQARQLFRDAAFFRDTVDNASLALASRATINFRSLQFPASVPKVYGQTGLMLSEFLADLAALSAPVRASSSPSPTPMLLPTPSATPSSGSISFSGLTNVALNRPVRASSTRPWPDVTGAAETANDGLKQMADGRNSLWHSESNRGELEWWQVDLSQPVLINALEIFFREDQDQGHTRRNFEILVSNDPSFATSTPLAAQGSTPVAFHDSWKAAVNDSRAYRYVRVQKTQLDADANGQVFFNLTEVRVYGLPRASAPLSLAELTPRTVLIGETLSFTLAQTDAKGQSLQLRADHLPENASFDAATGVFTFTPAPSQASNLYQVRFTTNDSQGAKFDITVLSNNAPRVMMLAPTAADRLVINRQLTLSWATETTAQIAAYQIRLSTDGGASYPMVIANLPGSASQYQWLVPQSFNDLRRAQVRLMVVAVDGNNNVGLDCNHQDLSVAGSLAVVSAASYRSVLAPGSINSAFGTELITFESAIAESLPLPLQLGGTRIEIVDSQGARHQAPLFYAGHNPAGYDQINFYLPEEVSVGQATITITSAIGVASACVAEIQPAVPALFTISGSGSGEAVMISTTDGVNYELNVAKQHPDRDVYVVLFGTGWRQRQGTNTNNSAGSLQPSEPVVVEINNTPVTVFYAGPQPEFAGLDQINIRLPRDLVPGLYPLIVRIGHETSNPALIRVI
jgi:uncharacterized protein (TIGR03437 family)